MYESIYDDRDEEVKEDLTDQNVKHEEEKVGR